MTDAPDSLSNELAAGYKSVGAAPFVYFAFVPTFGTLGGAVQIELAARTLTPLQNGGVGLETVETARLRCTPAAAKFLRDALDGALKMLEQPQSISTRFYRKTELGLPFNGRDINGLSLFR